MKLLQLLLQVYKDEYELNIKEGLIKTTELKKTVGILYKSYKDYAKFSTELWENTFSVTIKYKNELHHEFLPAKKMDFSKFQDLLRDANNLGWFPSYIESRNYSGKYKTDQAKYLIDNNENLYIVFEAKFDIEFDNYPSILYHVAPKKYTDKILKIGLVPKSKEKASSHPDRIYLANSEEDATYLLYPFYKKTGNKEWTLFSVDTEMIPGDYFKLYDDPNYKRKGFYTLNNIPPQAIKRIKDINIDDLEDQ